MSHVDITAHRAAVCSIKGTPEPGDGQIVPGVGVGSASPCTQHEDEYPLTGKGIQ